jgi:hypothetical protein
MIRRRRSALLPAAVAALAVLGASPLARAGGPESSPDERERTALYAEGVAFANAGQWEEAAKRFRRVVAIRSAPPALFTLAQADEHVGQLATAARGYESALASARASGQTDVADAAARALSAIVQRVPSILPRLEPAVPGATATIDGADVTVGVPTKVDPGSHVVALRAPDHRPFEARVNLVPGQSMEVRIKLEPLGPQPAPPPAVVPASAGPDTPPPAEPEGHGKPLLPLGPLVLGGAGVAAGVVGLVVRFTAQASYDSASSSCSGGACPTQSSVNDGNAARTRMILGTVLLGAGVAAVAGAGVWWVTVLPSHGGASATLSARF